MNGRWPLLYLFSTAANKTNPIPHHRYSRGTVSISSSYSPLLQLRLLNRDPDLLRSRRAVLSVDPVRECLAF